jgi:hypothetical protein
MATTTTNYGFDIPQSTDLVKDGATAIATLGQDIDTAMNTALGTKKAGMVLLNTTSFSGVASISIPQDTFTSTYRNYHIRLNVAGSAATFLKMKLRAAGVDTTASSYVWSVTRSSYASGAFGGYSGNGVDFFEITDLTNSTTDVFDSQINIYRPKDAVVTNIAVNGRGVANGATFISGSFNATTSFDAITLFPNTGNITGFIQVYGCNQ